MLFIWRDELPLADTTAFGMGAREKMSVGWA